MMVWDSGGFIHRSDSIYDDSPADRYQFPRQYLRRVEACVGDWIVYYEPRKVAETRGYFAVAKVERVIPDPTASGMYLALIEPGSYLDFANPVPFSDAEGVIGGRWTRTAPILSAMGWRYQEPRTGCSIAGSSAFPTIWRY